MTSAAAPDPGAPDPGAPDPGVSDAGALDPAAVHDRSVDLIRRMDAGDLPGVGTLLGELTGPEEFAAQVVSLASLARLLLDQLTEAGPEQDEARGAVLRELARVLVTAEGA